GGLRRTAVLERPELARAAAAGHLAADQAARLAGRSGDGRAAIHLEPTLARAGRCGWAGGALRAGSAGLDECGLVGPGRRDSAAADSADGRAAGSGRRALELGLLGDRAADQAPGDSVRSSTLYRDTATLWLSRAAGRR